MARRRYFDHVDPNGRGSNILIHEAGYTLRPEWIRNKRQYNFESIAAGDTSASTALLQLIKDPGITPPMHRHHLLGIDAFWADCTHGAVAFVRCAECPFKTYTVVLVAKH
jgi:uncharacterized protein YkwD